jgi:uncharacterized membrane protein YcaP (DUF421 family)
METVIRGAVLYLFLLVVIRLAGRRTLAQMTTFDLVLVLIIAETTQQGLLGDDFSITNAAVLIVTLIGLDVALSFLKGVSPLADKFIEGRPQLLVTDGVPDEPVMRKARIDVSEILEAARGEGLERLDQVKYAVLESGGAINIIPARDA